jgi:NitT/TauT family transport system ATP-binding protein
MKMRVSLARALVTQPDLLLLDEPFAALDEITRFNLNNDLAELWRKRRFTVIFVTHSVVESVYLSQRIVVLAARPGRIHADLPVKTAMNRTEEFRSSVEYANLCSLTSENLKGAMRA